VQAVTRQNERMTCGKPGVYSKKKGKYGKRIEEKSPKGGAEDQTDETGKVKLG